MRATEQDRTFSQATNSGSKKALVFALIVALLVIAGAAYFFLADEDVVAVKKPTPGTDQGDYRIPLPQVPTKIVDLPGFTLPILNESDGEFRTRLIDMNPDLAPWLQSEELIRRGVTFNDGLSKGEILFNLLSLPTPEGKFKTSSEGGRVYLSPDNYSRYSYLSRLAMAADIEKLAEIFHLFRPLLEEAYGELGYQGEDFGASVIFTLDQIIATPVIDAPIELKPHMGYYIYADPALESLKPIQKQLIRMGPEVTRGAKEKAQRLKENLLAEEAPTGEDFNDAESIGVESSDEQAPEPALETDSAASESQAESVD
ncbi:MAG: DUF3014 domain-containing protein [bacterium]